VTTQLQAFGLIVTAEPYFAVTQPSDVVVLENVIRDDTNGSFEVIQAKYELLTRGAYLMNQDAARLTIKPLEPGSPMDLAQARNAVELARLAGADRFATETFTKAAGLLASAEEARTARRGGNAIMMPARQAAQTAEDARLVGLKRQEDAFEADQRASALAREQDAVARAQEETARRRDAEAATQAATAGRVAAEREANASAAARLAAERDASLAAEARLSAERARATDADNARLAAETARAQADAARVAAEAKAQSDAASAAAKSEQDKAALRAQLREQLNVILDTRETARGLIINLSDVLFDTGRADLKPGAREKLARISGILALHPGLHLEVEGHTDDVGTNDSNQRLSERRGESVRTYLVQQGIASTSIGTIGLGETKPVATNGTAAGRQQNRRVELIVSGESIGRL
jgi:outer membrane protein OmpA-like peptidoglycan-associated protein